MAGQEKGWGELEDSIVMDNVLRLEEILLSMGSPGKALAEELNAWRDGNGLSLMSLAAASGARKCLEHLLGLGCDPNPIDRKGNRPVLWAATGASSKECLRALAGAGADLDVRNEHGDAAVDVAASVASKQALLELALLGARFDIPGAEGRLPHEHPKIVHDRRFVAQIKAAVEAWDLRRSLGDGSGGCQQQGPRL